MKIQTVASIDQVDAMVEEVTESAKQALLKISRLGPDGLRALWEMKFKPIGCDPLDSQTPLNMIEQLNQSFTYIASAEAARILLSSHPDLGPFKLNLGTTGGSDIESTGGEGMLAAEVFAAVKPSNNRKLASDIDKVARTAAKFKYVFFMCPGYGEGHQPKLSRSGVVVWSVGAEL